MPARLCSSWATTWRASALLVAAGSVSLTASDAGAEPTAARVAVGDPFAFGDKPAPPARGSLGPLTSERPPDPTHPEPRVIVDVLSAKGVARDAAEAALRKGAWGKVVTCYKARAWAEPTLELDVAMSVTARGGAVKSVKRAGGSGSGKKARGKGATKPKAKGPGRAPSADAAPPASLGACLEKALVGIAMPKTKSTASARVRIRVTPGDEPVSPPKDVLTRGEGQLDLARARLVIEGSAPDLQACHDHALAYAPKLWGDLAIRFKVEEGGQVVEAFEAGGPFPEDRVTRCVLRRARTLRFEAPRGGWMRFVVPMTLTP